MIKKSYIFTLLAALTMLACVSCQEEAGVAPKAIDAATITAQPDEGQVTLSWQIPTDADYHYVKVVYTLPNSDKVYVKNASIYSNSMVIGGLLARYGQIDFAISTVSKEGVESEVSHIKAQCLPVPPDYSVTPAAAVQLSRDAIWSDKGEFWEGPIEDLVDGDENSFFHSTWSWDVVTYDSNGNKNPDPVEMEPSMPVMIVVKLPRPISAFNFSIINRNNGNRSNPETIEIYVGNSFSTASFDETNPAYGNRLIGTVSGLPGEQKASYTSPALFDTGEPFQYVWFKIKSITSGQDFVAISELTITEYNVDIYDPENE